MKRQMTRSGAAVHTVGLSICPCRLQKPKKDINITAIAFLSLLKMARHVLIQDSGWWRQQYPHHDIWRRFPALTHPRVLDFQDKVMRLHKMSTAELAFVPRNSVQEVGVLSLFTDMHQQPFADRLQPSAGFQLSNVAPAAIAALGSHLGLLMHGCRRWCCTCCGARCGTCQSSCRMFSGGNAQQRRSTRRDSSKWRPCCSGKTRCCSNCWRCRTRCSRCHRCSHPRS